MFSCLDVGRSVSCSPPVQDSRNKLLSPPRPTTKEQKPFRGFDISSLIRKDDEDGEEEERPSPASPASSPRLSLGPPVERSTNPYNNIFNSNLYQHYLGQILHHQQAAAAAAAPPFPAAPHLPPAFNPMLLQAHLASMAATNPLLSAAGFTASSVLAERMKAHRFSPYSTASHNSSLNTSITSSLSSPGSASAFVNLATAAAGVGGQRSPPVSPPHSATPPPSSALSPPSPTTSPVTMGVKSELRSMENMISGLEGAGDAGRFSIKHDSRKFV